MPNVVPPASSVTPRAVLLLGEVVYQAALAKARALRQSHVRRQERAILRAIRGTASCEVSAEPLVCIANVWRLEGPLDYLLHLGSAVLLIRISCAWIEDDSEVAVDAAVANRVYRSSRWEGNYFSD
jgi:hypothetical protein